MKKIPLNELSEAAQQLLAEGTEDEPVIIENDNGTVRYGVIPYRKPTDQQKQRAWVTLRRLQKKAAASMKKHGVTEDDVMREILEDD